MTENVQANAAASGAPPGTSNRWRLLRDRFGRAFARESAARSAFWLPLAGFVLLLIATHCFQACVTPAIETALDQAVVGAATDSSAAAAAARGAQSRTALSFWLTTVWSTGLLMIGCSAIFGLALVRMDRAAADASDAVNGWTTAIRIGVPVAVSAGCSWIASRKWFLGEILQTDQDVFDRLSEVVYTHNVVRDVLIGVFAWVTIQLMLKSPQEAVATGSEQAKAGGTSVELDHKGFALLALHHRILDLLLGCGAGLMALGVVEVGAFAHFVASLRARNGAVKAESFDALQSAVFVLPVAVGVALTMLLFAAAAAASSALAQRTRSLIAALARAPLAEAELREAAAKTYGVGADFTWARSRVLAILSPVIAGFLPSLFAAVLSAK